MKSKLLNHYFSVYLLALWIFIPALKAQKIESFKFSEQNINYLYQSNTSIKIDTRVTLNQQEATIYLKLNLGVFDTLREKPQVFYQMSSSYDNQLNDFDSLEWNNRLYHKENGNYFIKWQLPLSPGQNNILFLQIIHLPSSEKPFLFDIPITTERNYPPANIVAMGEEGEIPIFKNYITQNDSFRISSPVGTMDSVFVYYYDMDFGPNPPPMAEEEQVQKELKIDSTFSIPVGVSLNFNKEGLYFIQSDTSSLSGISFRVTDIYFPKFKRVSQLIGPLRYISTNEEMNSLQNADDEEQKKALDNFWLDITQSRERAKRIIRDYFQQVAQTNKIFTNYKEGWKTGQGMIYLLYGIPDEVYRDDEKEIWHYYQRNNLSELKFTFVKVKNLFSNHHYELLRRDNYKKFWYRNIDLWRKGRKNI